MSAQRLALDDETMQVFNAHHDAMAKEVIAAYHKGLWRGKKMGASAGFVSGVVFTVIVLAIGALL